LGKTTPLCGSPQLFHNFTLIPGAKSFKSVFEINKLSMNSVPFLLATILYLRFLYKSDGLGKVSKKIKKIVEFSTKGFPPLPPPCP